MVQDIKRDRRLYPSVSKGILYEFTTLFDYYTIRDARLGQGARSLTVRFRSNVSNHTSKIQAGIWIRGSRGVRAEQSIIGK